MYCTVVLYSGDRKTFNEKMVMGSRIIDFHTHILPGIDDGSRDIETTRRMFEKSAEQGVEVIVATPHFYASRDRVDHFLEKRSRARELVEKSIQDCPVQLHVGAEVAFFRGISRAEKLDSLTIDGKDLLLLEMPYMPWEASDIEEVETLIEERGYRVLLAHIERYLDLPGNGHRVGELLELPVYAQINAQSLMDWRKRGRLVRMFRDGKAHVLGSDTHGLHRRPPDLAEGRAVLERKLGHEFLDQMDSRGCELLGI